MGPGLLAGLQAGVPVEAVEGALREQLGNGRLGMALRGRHGEARDGVGCHSGAGEGDGDVLSTAAPGSPGADAAGPAQLPGGQTFCLAKAQQKHLSGGQAPQGVEEQSLAELAAEVAGRHGPADLATQSGVKLRHHAALLHPHVALLQPHTGRLQHRHYQHVRLHLSQPPETGPYLHARLPYPFIMLSGFKDILIQICTSRVEK